MKTFLFYILAALILLGVGIFMIAMPDAFLGIFVIIFSIFLILNSLRSIYSIFAFKLASLRLKWSLGVKAFINAVIGIIAIVIAMKNLSMISHLLVYLIAIDFFISAIVDGVDYILLKRASFPTGTLGIEILLAILFGLLFFIFPSFISHTAVTILAVVIICIGVMVGITGAYSLYIDRTFKKFGIDRKGVKKAEAEFVDMNKES